jgi:allantoinase
MSQSVPNTIRSRRVVLPEGERPASIVMRNGIIERIDPYGSPAGEAAEDLGDLVVLPGLIDPHVHVNEPGRTAWEGFATATRAAAAGGITLLADMPLNSSPVTTSLAALDAKRAAAGKLTIDVAFHGGLVPGNTSALPELIAGGVMGIKAFLCDSGLDDFPATGSADLSAAMSLLGPGAVPLLAHAELIGDPPPMKNPRSFADFVASRPRRFEQDAVRLLIDLCRQTGCPIHIVHLADAHCLPLLRDARRAGLPITVETCPHYLFFNPAAIPDGATQYKCTPPLRGDGPALLQALLEGDIDLVASDHSPCLPAMKQTDGRFDLAWGGISSLQLGASIVRSIDARITPARLARWMSEAPARLLGVAQERGRIAPGRRADFAVMDWDDRWIVRAAKLHHRHAITPYEGCTLTGLIRRTYLAGRCIFDVAAGFPTVSSGSMVCRPASAPSLTVPIFNDLPGPAAIAALLRCCGALAWCQRMSAARPFGSVDALHRASERSFDALSESDWREAFAAHPRIGGLSSLRMTYPGNKEWSAGEQAGVDRGDDAMLTALADGNAQYEARFGHIFIVCATGRTAGQMLDLLRARLHNPPALELAIAAGEQRKITRLRIDKLFA